MTDIGPGDIVVCVDADDSPSRLPPLVAGASYRVREIDPYTWRRDGKRPSGGVSVHDQRFYNEWGGRLFYSARRFRPIRDGDAEIFRQIVRDVPADRETVKAG